MASYANYSLHNATLTDSGTGATVDTLPNPHVGVVDSTARVYLECTNVGGTTPTLDVNVEAVLDDGSVVVLASFAQVTADANETKTITQCPRNVRASWVAGGSGETFDTKISITRF